MVSIFNFKFEDIFIVLPIIVAIYYACNIAFDNGGKSLMKKRWKFMLPYKRLQIIFIMATCLFVVTYMIRIVLMVILY